MTPAAAKRLCGEVAIRETMDRLPVSFECGRPLRHDGDHRLGAAPESGNGEFDPELAQRSADWLYARSFDGAPWNGGNGPLAAAAMDLDFALGRWDVRQRGSNAGLASGVRLSLRERVTAALGEGVADLFEVDGSDAEVVMRLRSLDEIDALPSIRDRLDLAGFEATALWGGEISVREVA